MKQCRSCGVEKPLEKFEITRQICNSCRSRQKVLAKFKLSVDEYNKLFELQQGRCGICGKHQTEFDKALAIDHDHETNNVRGLLCMMCNTALGKFNDNKEALYAAIRYLDTAQGRLQAISTSNVESAGPTVSN